jgi:hypothetical protein
MKNSKSFGVLAVFEEWVAFPTPAAGRDFE